MVLISIIHSSHFCSQNAHMLQLSSRIPWMVLILNNHVSWLHAFHVLAAFLQCCFCILGFVWYDEKYFLFTSSANIFVILACLFQIITNYNKSSKKHIFFTYSYCFMVSIPHSSWFARNSFNLRLDRFKMVLMFFAEPEWYQYWVILGVHCQQPLVSFDFSQNWDLLSVGHCQQW